MIGIEIQSESGVVGRLIVAQRREELLEGLGAVEIVQVVEDVVDFEAGRSVADWGFGLGIKRTGVVVATESESP